MLTMATLTMTALLMTILNLTILTLATLTLAILTMLYYGCIVPGGRVRRCDAASGGRHGAQLRAAATG